MRNCDRKQIAEYEGRDAARAGQPRTACPYGERDRLNRAYNWRLGYDRAAREQARQEAA